MSFEQPIFAPPTPEPGRSRPPGRGRSCLVQALLAFAALALLAVVTAALCLNSALQGLQNGFSGCCSAGFGSSGHVGGGRGGSGAWSSAPPANTPPTAGSAATPPSSWPSTQPARSPAVESAASVFAQAFTQILIESILFSWGTDRAAENARRLEWIAQSVREYERLHGVPPPSLEALNVSRSDLDDVFGTPVHYRVRGSPAHWELRSAGSNRSFDDSDPWIAGP